MFSALKKARSKSKVWFLLHVSCETEDMQDNRTAKFIFG